MNYYIFCETDTRQILDYSSSKYYTDDNLAKPAHSRIKKIDLFQASSENQDSLLQRLEGG